MYSYKKTARVTEASINQQAEWIFCSLDVLYSHDYPQLNPAAARPRALLISTTFHKVVRPKTRRCPAAKTEAWLQTFGPRGPVWQTVYLVLLPDPPISSGTPSVRCASPSTCLPACPTRLPCRQINLQADPGKAHNQTGATAALPEQGVPQRCAEIGNSPPAPWKKRSG